MASETASSVDEATVVSSVVTTAADKRGKHRIGAQLKRVEQECRFLEEELEEFQRTENVSTLCEELLRNIEMIPDPLLPLHQFIFIQNKWPCKPIMGSVV
ncbi:hypothetical protein I3760_07G085200 [Carya illinoinensis]|uniref:guanine nucleotide-binding protein subunit gamma 2-like isoform X2 n=1 Tax=Carya illinoinensis TaxID=32201 RepID=UPI001BF97C09|nr:guanine nucleotide-binding protein subunit gamma 2-like isoform X2 [Carya illinoinensis]KAG2696979.1 hypothetical protein I3760_07G085200 [Carya illinoinensis]